MHPLKNLIKSNEKEVYTTSLIVAQVFEKRHDNIIRIIEGLPKDNFNALNFEGIYYIDKQNRKKIAYKITAKGFSLLGMSLTGAKAYQFKIMFIEAFDKQEKQIKAKNALHEKELEILISKIPFTDIKNHNGSDVYKYSTCNILIGYKSKKPTKALIKRYSNDFFNIDFEVFISKRFLSLRFTHRIRLNKQTIIKNNTLKEVPEYTAQSLTKNKVHYSQSKFEF